MELEIICPECNGKGSYKKLVPTFSANGKKRLKDKLMSFSCNKCKGNQKIPTEFGLAILEFVEKYQDFDTKVSDIVDRELKHREEPPYGY